MVAIQSSQLVSSNEDPLSQIRGSSRRHLVVTSARHPHIQDGEGEEGKGELAHTEGVLCNHTEVVHR